MKIIFHRLDNNDLPLPKYATEGSAAFDFQACLTRQSIIPGQAASAISDVIRIAPGEVILIPTGFKTAFTNAVLKLFIRSGLSIKGITLANNVGIIDSGYRGEIFIAVRNESKHYQIIVHGQRIAQGILEPLTQCILEEGTIDLTQRGTGGFGSTGI